MQRVGSFLPDYTSFTLLLYYFLVLPVKRNNRKSHIDCS